MELINYALVETSRPPVYTAMKYWGKKPHNIWQEYIDKFVPQNGVILDPFCGSAMSAIEAIRTNKKAICFDINPLSSFFIENYTSIFNIDNFKEQAISIIEKIKNDDLYIKLWEYNGIVHSCKYDNDIPYEI